MSAVICSCGCGKTIGYRPQSTRTEPTKAPDTPPPVAKSF